MKPIKPVITASRIDKVKIELDENQLEHVVVEWARGKYPQYADFTCEVSIDCCYDRPDTTITFERTSRE